MNNDEEIIFEKNAVEDILRKAPKITDQGKLIEVTWKPAVGKYENYASDILRLSVKIESHKGGLINKSIILKQKRQEKMSVDFSETLKVFATETKVYTKVLKTLEDIMEQQQTASEKMWADIYAYAENKIFFEDLSELGYKITKQGVGHNLEEAILVMTNLGRFHALSLVAVQNKQIDVNILGPLAFALDVPFFTKLYNKGIDDLCKYVEDNWSQEWPGVLNKLRTAQENLTTKLQKVYEATKGKFDVINHGDCWSNNIMIKYLPGSSNPDSLRFVDFQLCHYNSLGWDLNYYLYNTVRSKTRQKYLPLILEKYTESLRSNCHKFGYTGKVFTLEDVNQALDEASYFGFIIACSLAPYMISMSETDFDFKVDDLLEDNNDKEMYNCYKSKVVVSEMKNTLSELIEKKII